jgi:YidC/Oxa1 family membrane protein insertase
VLDFIYYSVSFILWCWHWVFGHVFGEASGISWVLGIMFLVFTLRAIMYKPFVKQVRSMRQMQEFGPEIKKIQKKYANDRQRQAQEMQKLQKEHGFSPLGGCLPMLLQIPVFIGLFHVLRSFGNVPYENYFFDEDGVSSYLAANLFGARLSNFITQPEAAMTAIGGDRTSVIIVSIPLMILASALTHLTAKHSVSRQNPESATAQTAIMNKLTLYIFPLGVLIFGFFFPIGLLLYWLANNTWTLAQQRLVYRRIDREEAEKKAAVVEKRNTLAPKPGQRPQQAKKKPATPAAKASEPEIDPATNEPKVNQPKKPAPGQSSGVVKRRQQSAKSGGANSAKKPGGNTSKSTGNGSTKGADAGSDSTVSGLGAGRSRKKNTGRKNR